MGTLLDELQALIDNYEDKVDAGTMSMEEARLYQDAIFGLVKKKRAELELVRWRLDRLRKIS